MIEGKEPQLIDYNAKVLPQDFNMDKENSVVENVPRKEGKDLVKEFQSWVNNGKVSEKENSDLSERENKKTPQDIVAAINFLKQNSSKIAFNNYPKSFDLIKNTINKTIENIKKDNNYFINAKLKQIEQKPLDNDKWPISMRKALLKAEFNNIKYDNVVNEILLKKIGSDLLSDEEVNRVFNMYREFNLEYFYWLENHDRRDDYHNQSLINGYNITPKLAENNYDKLQVTRDCCYSKMSKKYAAIYTPQGNIDSFFQVDQELSLKDEEVKQKNGNINESNLEYFLNKFKKDIESGKSDGLRYYLQIRKDLPEEISRDIEEELSLSIPEKLDKHFDSMDEFEKAITCFGNGTAEYFKELDKKKQEYLVNNLESLLDRRKEEAGEKYFGFRSEDIEMLDFYKSFLKRNPNSIKPYAHFSVCYYLYLRKDLPEDLVSDFEEKFSIEIPDKFKSFGSQDDYLKNSDKDLLEPFKKPFRQKIEGIEKEVLSMDFVKMQEYLYEKIDELDQKIKSIKIQPERLDIDEVLESEGFKKENMSEEEYKKMVLTYKTLIELPMREKIENEFGIELKNFNIREQVQFVNFLSSKSVKEVEEVKEFLNQGQDEEAKNNRIKAFLSLESGEEMGGNILKIGKNLDARSADEVFAKYTEIVNLTDKTREDLEELFKDKKDVSDKEREKIIQNILNKAGQVLVDFSKEFDRKGKNNNSEVLKKLDNYQSNLILAASVYKSIDKNEGVSFEDLRGVFFEQRKAGNFSDSEIDEMLTIYGENYKDKPKLQAKLVENFKNILENKNANTHIYFYKKDDKIVAFNRFDQKEGEKGKKYFGSYNVDSILRGSEIGASLLKASLDKEAKDNIIEADCDPNAQISARYISSRCEFVVKKIIPNYGNSGETIFNIERKETNKKYHFHGYKDKDIISEYKQGVVEGQDKDKFIMKFQAGSKELFDKAEELVNKNGYIISNYLFGSGNEVYCAFEKE